MQLIQQGNLYKSVWKDEKQGREGRRSHTLLTTAFPSLLTSSLSPSPSLPFPLLEERRVCVCVCEARLKSERSGEEGRGETTGEDKGESAHSLRDLPN